MNNFYATKKRLTSLCLLAIGLVSFNANSQCTAVATFSEDFSGFTTFPENCWTGNLPSYPTTSITATKTLQLYSGNQPTDVIVVSPEVSTIDGQHKLVFDILLVTNPTTTVQIGTMSDNTDFSTFSAIGAAFTPVVGSYSTPAIAANAGHKYLAVKFIHGGGHGKVLELDNIEWTTSASGPKFDTSKVTVYPNPTSGIFNVESTLDIKQIAVYNSLGQRVLSTEKKDINLQNAANGLYFVTVRTNDGAEATYKLIKK